MSENLIERVAPHLAAPVTREAIRSASEADDGPHVALVAAALLIPACFAGDDAD